MPDIEKTKTGLFEMLQRDTWKDIDPERSRFQPVLNDALALLKVRPPEKGKWVVDEYMIYHCPFCCAINNTFYKSFCPNCGADLRGGERNG